MHGARARGRCAARSSSGSGALNLWKTVLYRNNADEDQVSEREQYESAVLDEAYHVDDIQGTEKMHAMAHLGHPLMPGREAAQTVRDVLSARNCRLSKYCLPPPMTTKLLHGQGHA